jgi:hypothetical protein
MRAAPNQKIDEPPIDTQERPARRGLGGNFTWLLPDLQTLVPSELRLLASQSGSRRVLRFSNTVWNHGPGALEMRGLLNPDSDTILITQMVYRLNGASAGMRIGESIFHPTHEHWHFESFAVYEIWSAAPDGTLIEREVSSGKVGYCGRDDRRLKNAEIGLEPGEEDYPGSRRPAYTGCNWWLQGISVGWTDIYRHHLPGQELDISGLPDGLYALVSTVNPVRQILEAEYENNANRAYFQLEGNRLQVVDI